MNLPNEIHFLFICYIQVERKTKKKIFFFGDIPPANIKVVILKGFRRNYIKRSFTYSSFITHHHADRVWIALNEKKTPVSAGGLK